MDDNNTLMLFLNAVRQEGVTGVLLTERNNEIVILIARKEQENEESDISNYIFS